MEKIAVIVVLYYPDLDHLNTFIKSLAKQSDLIFLIDNTPRDGIDFSKIDDICSNVKCKYIPLFDNYGIAYAHNVGIKEFKESDCNYVVIFDQDSSVQQDFIMDLFIAYKNLSHKCDKIAAIGPAFRDTKTGLISPAIRLSGLKVNRVFISNDVDYTQSDYIISSGTLISRNSINIIGDMLSELFIDYVDVEWGLRAKKLGYKCFIVNNVVMSHTIGDQSKYVPIIKRYVNIHSDFRKYFLLRNPLYLILYSKNVPLNWKLIQIPKVFLYLFFVLIYVRADFSVLKIFFKAVRDAVTKKMGKGSM
ncbi:glycosyltransferase family 2 protein [Acinetobacter pittii]|uniref:glycosyltransferase family 2 protein n=1 Tax=Acinetobacter TaxID=469 RepID=UPI0024DE45B3|nr:MULTISPECIES: glycosyltransferase family 2 protein [Acinetobacter]MDU6157356.1 glycosyltransferase family 2 protein [Acinetobacter sp.]